MGRPVIAVHTGYVTSKTDGQRHYIGVGDLLSLYRVPRGVFRIVIGHGDVTVFANIHLYPLFDGEYEKVRDAKLGPFLKEATDEAD